MRLGIVGAGVVGRATARCFMEHCEVRVYDVVKERATHSLEEVLKCDLVMVCLPSPQMKDSLACDLSYIEQFFGSFRSAGKCWERGDNINFVLRSTVPIGTTKALSKNHALKNIVHSPEFLTARCSITDAQIPARNIIGYPATPAGGFGNECGSMLHTLYDRRFPGVPVHVMSSDESESVKLFLNSFFAVKLAYWNEVRALSDQLDMNWDRIMEGVLSDGRIAHAHTRVPGPDGFGFAGSCLPKDLANLIDCLHRAYVPDWLTFAAHKRNIDDRKRKC